MNNPPRFATKGWLLDLYPRSADMVLWFILEDGRRLRVLDRYQPEFYMNSLLELNSSARGELHRMIERLEGLQLEGPTRKRDFWSNQIVSVEAVRVTDLERFDGNLRALARHCPALTLYNCDIAPEILYCYQHQLFSTGRCELEIEGDRLLACRMLESPQETQYEPPPLRIATLTAQGARVVPRPGLRALAYAIDGRTEMWEDGAPREILLALNEALSRDDPDVILTRGGDSLLMPLLFTMALRCKLALNLDREPGIERRVQLEGRSCMSYGKVLYSAPDYPLFGRWHVDEHNSFWTSHTRMAGLLEVARISKLPVQRAARRSIGTGISSIQLDLACREGFLIPWKKTQPERWKSAAQLIKCDRGGLVYQPLVGVYENIVELDFVSMYPAIMVSCNVSPETVGCPCCADDPRATRAPDAGYAICRRHQGLVPRAIAPIIEKRRLYKKLMKIAPAPGESPEDWKVRHEQFDGRQDALKWLLVCCFGYLGYRNARFGRIEAHEATCAFSREKLLQAHKLAEAHGWRVLHSIVDCLWLEHGDGKVSLGSDKLEACIQPLVEAINQATGLTISVEGHYSWIVFLPSAADPQFPVPNRYFGRFTTGKLKYRGIELRRHDQPPFIQSVQRDLLERLAECTSLSAIRNQRETLVEIVNDAERRLRENKVELEDLLIRRAASKQAGDYRGNGMMAIAMRQAARAGVRIHPGESITYLVVNGGDVDRDARVRLLPLLRVGESYDLGYYLRQLRRAAATILEPLLGINFEPAKPTRKIRRNSLTETGVMQLELFD